MGQVCLIQGFFKVLDFSFTSGHNDSFKLTLSADTHFKQMGMIIPTLTVLREDATYHMLSVEPGKKYVLKRQKKSQLLFYYDHT